MYILYIYIIYTYSYSYYIYIIEYIHTFRYIYIGGVMTSITANIDGMAHAIRNWVACVECSNYSQEKKQDGAPKKGVGGNLKWCGPVRYERYPSNIAIVYIYIYT